MARCASTPATRSRRSVVSSTSWFFSGRHMPTVPISMASGLRPSEARSRLRGLEDVCGFEEVRVDAVVDHAEFAQAPAVRP